MVLVYFAFTRLHSCSHLTSSLKVWFWPAKNTTSVALSSAHTSYFRRKISLEVRYDGEGVRVGPRGVLGPAGAAALDEHVVLAGEGDGAERDDEEQVGHVRLHALAVQEIALLRAANEKKVFVIKFSWTKQKQ